MLHCIHYHYYYLLCAFDMDVNNCVLRNLQKEIRGSSCSTVYFFERISTVFYLAIILCAKAHYL
jgi:hypothetical protein